MSDTAKATRRITHPQHARGFQNVFTSQTAWPPAGEAGPGYAPPKPLPKRPKGRFTIGFLLFMVVASLFYAVWDAFLGVVAYGVVEGDTLRIAAPWNGVVQDLLVSEGDVVRRGQVLAELNSPELLRQRAKAQDDLKVERSALVARTAHLRQESQTLAADYFELWGLLLKGREELHRMQNDLARLNRVKDLTIVPEQERDQLVFAEAGQREMLGKLELALDELRRRHDETPIDGNTPSELQQLQPNLARIEALSAELARIDEQLAQGQLRSPVNGVVVMSHQPEGQHVAASEMIMEVVDEQSIHSTLYLSQSHSRMLKPGDEITVSVEPLHRSVPCRVIRSRERFEEAPSAIRRFYKDGQPLLPVTVEAIEGTDYASLLQPGAVTRFTLTSRVAAWAREFTQNRNYETPIAFEQDRRWR